MKFSLTALLIINAAAFLLMLVDKIRAQKNAWRIPERTLLLTAALGGSLGVLVGMRLFRHKTLHPKFALGIPVIFAVHCLIAVLILTKTA